MKLIRCRCGCEAANGRLLRGVRENTERPESLTVGANELAGTDPAGIVEAACRMIRRPRQWLNPFGDGRSGERIISLLAA